MLDFLNEISKNDSIKKIYYNDYSFSEQVPNTNEYRKIQKKLRKILL